MTDLNLPMSAVRKRRKASIRTTAVLFGILAYSPIAHAEKGDTYLIAGWGIYSNLNTAAVSHLLNKEFPRHTTFVGRVCTRYCATRQIWDPGHSQEGSEIGVGYTLSDDFAVEISWMNGPSVDSTVVQASNPLWHIAEHKVKGLRLHTAYVYPLSPRFTLEIKAGLLNYRSRISYKSYIGDGGVDNLQGSGSLSLHDSGAHFSAGLGFGISEGVETSLQLSTHQDSDFSFGQSLLLQVKMHL